MYAPYCPHVAVLFEKDDCEESAVNGWHSGRLSALFKWSCETEQNLRGDMVETIFLKGDMVARSHNTCTQTIEPYQGCFRQLP